MHDLARFTGFLAAAYGIAIAAWPGLRRRNWGTWFSLVCGGVVMLTPLLIGRESVQLRALACVLAIDLFAKIVDYATQQRRGVIGDTSLRAFLAFLVPFPVFLVQFGQRKQRADQFTLPQMLSMLAGFAIFALCFAVVIKLSHVDLVRSSFLLDHTLKFILFAIAVESLARGLHGVERIAGYDTPPLINTAIGSVTVGEFWRRYNTRIHGWLDQNVSRPVGGMRRPVRSIILVFAVSGVLHEIGFAVATSRLDGYQFTFFILQAPAIIFLPHDRPSARLSRAARVLSHCVTILWLWATSMFFFHGVDRVFPFFYAADPWLP